MRLSELAPSHPTRALASAVMATLVAAVAIPGCAHDKAAQKPAPAPTASAKPAAKPQPPAFQVNHEDWAKIGYKLDWVGYPFLGEGQSPQVTILHAYDDIIIAQNRQSTVSVLETNNGQTRWSAQLAGPLTKFVGIDRDPTDASRIIVSSESEAFAMAAANGNILARERFEKVVNTRPVIVGDEAIYGTSMGEVMAHVLGRSVKAWGFSSVGSIEAAPVLVGDVIGVVSQGGDVMFLSSGGSLLGRARIFDGLDNNPVSDGGMLFIAGRDRSVWAFDTGGNQVWRYRTSVPLTNQPAAHNGMVYLDIPGTGMTAFDETNGKVLWSAAKVSGRVIGTRSGRLLVAHGQTLTLLDNSRGDILEQITVPAMAKIVVDTFDNGRIYVVNDRGNVAKFIPR